MKKVDLFVTVIFFQLVSFGFAQNNKRPDIVGFRDMRWGMSRQDIKRHQSTPIVDETNTGLIFKEKIDEDTAAIIYMFTSTDELFAVMLVFEIQSADENMYSRKFREKFLILTKKYENPTYYNTEELKKEGLQAIWKFAKTSIMLQLKYAQPYNKLALGIIYFNEIFGKQFFNEDILKKY